MVTGTLVYYKEIDLYVIELKTTFIFNLYTTVTGKKYNICNLIIKKTKNKRLVTFFGKAKVTSK